MDPGSSFSSIALLVLEEAGAYLFSMQTLCYNCRKVLTSYVCSLMDIVQV